MSSTAYDYVDGNAAAGVLTVALLHSAAVIGWTTTPPPSASPSSVGGISGSCIHRFSLKNVPTSVMRGFISRLPCFATGVSPHSGALLTMRTNPDATGKTI